MPDVAIALDFPGWTPARRVMDRLRDTSRGRAGGLVYKVGLELFTREGPSVLRELRQEGQRIFLDLKLYDIPNTVAGAVAAAVDEGVEFLTVHATGGDAMVRAAAEAAEDGPKILAVTVLTSLSADELAEMWRRDRVSVREEAARIATGAVRAGAAGVVASALEVPTLRERLPEGSLMVTPGIRLKGDGAHDQARVVTPWDAVRAGADLLVVGRSVTRSSDPAGALERVWEEMGRAAEAGESTLVTEAER